MYFRSVLRHAKACVGARDRGFRRAVRRAEGRRRLERLLLGKRMSPLEQVAAELYGVACNWKLADCMAGAIVEGMLVLSFGPDIPNRNYI